MESCLWRCSLKNSSGSDANFPPGATFCGQRSEWREFAFALHQIQDAIGLALPLKQVMSQWNHIAAALAESHRKRSLQNRDLKSPQHENQE
jgi:hypothetical protein